ncbi:MAG: hypothetical protein IJ410_05925 [Oscillospiraceae bacterium]|nr:hypothetical protein [Oscillospiraceae bacterium]
MSEFITGLVLGIALTFFTTQYYKWKSCFIAGRLHSEKNNDNVQWQNIMNYDGSGRGQRRDED